MFKLIKILNSGANVPESVKLPKFTDICIKQGDAVILVDGGVTCCGESSRPTHIALQNADYSADSILCYEIHENMLFEAPLSENPTSLSIGSKVLLNIDGDNSAFGVCAGASSGGVATVVDLMGAKQAGDKITVKF